MTAPLPPEHDLGQDDDPPDVDLLLLVVLRLLNGILLDGTADRGRVEAVRNAVRRYRKSREGT